MLPSVSHPARDDAEIRGCGEWEPVHGAALRQGEPLLGAATRVPGGSQLRGAVGSLSCAGGSGAGSQRSDPTLDPGRRGGAEAPGIFGTGCRQPGHFNQSLAARRFPFPLVAGDATRVSLLSVPRQGELHGR